MLVLGAIFYTAGMSDYIEINRANWDCVVEHHVKAYDLDKFRADEKFLSYVVQFDQARLGSVEGLNVVHLQCHIGTDTLSLARLGAASVTGLDFSPKAIAAARRFAAELGVEATFVEANVYDAPRALAGRRFDLVYTGIGALCWIADIKAWARVVADLLVPGGRLFIREGHPMLWALSDPREDGLLVVQYPYFESAGLHFFNTKSYVEHEGELSSPESVQFNHGLGEVITALMAAGLTLTMLEEHDSIPWNALGEGMEFIGEGEYRLRENPRRLAASYTLQATKTSS
jgi:SAM-dependent methyltransferase